MGGNVVDSRSGSDLRVAGTLLGPEGTATVESGPFVVRIPACGGSFWSGSRPEAHTVGREWPSLVGLMVGLGFGGVFVNWIVDASI